MEYIKEFIQIFMHLDAHLNVIINDFGVWTYLILFLIIFCETGLVVTPLLPGDSLLFAAGNFAAMGSLRAEYLFISLAIAAVLGDTVNYGVGRFMGPKVFHRKDSRIFKKEYLDKTHGFYERYGGKTIILARFVPIVRTFAPFVAGIGAMSYGRFVAYNIVGGVSWIGLFVFGGYFFGNLALVKNNFTAVILAIIVISVLPGLIEVARHRRRA
ncbi:MAG: DedA family protein [Deltaproteobacteria bacterium]|nr:DedA family protein [Deltaproteobacteria bacterium]